MTGEPVPDEAARVPAWRYVNPRPAAWPEADFIAGNPPFIGTARMREALGDGYVEAIRRVYPHVPDSADYVMFWWDKAAELVRTGRARRFGLITTNSLRQTFNRRVLEHHFGAGIPPCGRPDRAGARPGLHLAFAIPDHPWVDSAEGAAVRIAMTVGAAGEGPGVLQQVVSERPGDNDTAEITLAECRGRILPDLTTGSDVAGAQPLQANGNISGRGVQLFGSGFIVTPQEAANLGLGRVAGLEHHIRPYRNGRDLTAIPRDVMVIDLFGLTAEEVRTRFPAVYQWVYERVKPERDQNNRASYRNNWWIHGEPRAALRPALAGLRRYIATVETSRRRFFVFLDAAILPDNMLVNIALDDAYFLGVLSSRIHVTWALAAGGRPGCGQRPGLQEDSLLRAVPLPRRHRRAAGAHPRPGRAIGRHRKRQQAQHPKLALTDMYNVLEKLRAGEPLTAKDKTVHEQGLVSVLRDNSTTSWTRPCSTRTAGRSRWPTRRSWSGWSPSTPSAPPKKRRVSSAGCGRSTRRPDHASRFTQHALIQEDAPVYEVSLETRPLLPWPDRMAEQAQAVRAALVALGGPASAAQVAAAFAAAPPDRVAELLETLVTLGQARGTAEGRFVG